MLVVDAKSVRIGVPGTDGDSLSGIGWQFSRCNGFPFVFKGLEDVTQGVIVGASVTGMLS